MSQKKRYDVGAVMQYLFRPLNSLCVSMQRGMPASHVRLRAVACIAHAVERRFTCPTLYVSLKSL